MMDTPRVLEFLVEFLLKSGVIVFLGFAIVAAFRKWTPDWKHGVWMRVFAVALFVPLALLFPRIELIPNFGEVVVPVQTSGAEIAPSPVSTADSVSVPTRDSGWTLRWPDFALLVWLGGCLFLILRMFTASFRLRRLQERSFAPCREMGSHFRSVVQQSGVENVSLSLSDEVESPFTWGLIKSHIVIPTSSQQWSPRDLQMILRHELEHVKRRDSYGVLISRVFLCFNWVNPFAWVAMRQSIRFREEACDRQVLLAGHDPRLYAEMLFCQAKVANAGFLQTCATAMAETGTIERRIQMILKTSSISNSASGGTARARISTVLLTLLFLGVGFVGSQTNQDETATDKELMLIEANDAKLKEITIPKVEFSGTPLSDALAFLRQRSIELDVTEADPSRKGFNFVLNAPDMENTKITLRLTDVPFSEALRYTTNLAQVSYSVMPHAIVIVPLGSNPDLLFTNVYVLPGDFTKIGDGEFPAKEILEKAGVEFGVGSAAIFNPATSQLIIRNTQSQIEKTEAFIDALTSGKEEEFMKKIAEGWVAPAKGEEKLRAITIPKIEFKDTPLGDALAFLQMRSVELDVEEADPAKKGINIILEGEPGVDPRPVTLRLVNVPLAEAMRYTTELAGYTYVAEKHAVVVRPKQ